MKNLERIARRGFLAALALAGLAIWAIYTDEHESKNEHRWRLQTGRFFQEDFKPRETSRSR